jgi:hypothetical protein
MVPNPTDRLLGDERVEKHNASLPFHAERAILFFKGETKK